MAGTFSQPRMRLLANGVALPVIRADVRQTGYYGASKFSATLAAFGDAAHGPALWAGTDTYDVELQGGVLAAGAAEGAAGWQSLFMGQADEELEIDLDRGTVTLQGRDYSGRADGRQDGGDVQQPDAGADRDHTGRPGRLAGRGEQHGATGRAVL